jgi:CubicO group peptidase (beta-lactamase class C family)
MYFVFVLCERKNEKEDEVPPNKIILPFRPCAAANFLLQCASNQQGGAMTDQHNSSAIAARISRVENGITRDAPLWSQDTQHVSIRERMAYYKTPGLSLALINDGRIEWARGYGLLEADRSTPVTPETIFQVCSISKHVAMAGVLRLVQDGRIDLDEDINHYLTSWHLPANGDWQPRVSVRQLLAHTAGLTQNWYRGFGPGDPLPTLLDVLEGRPPANTPPIRAVLLPGSQFRYSGSHYSVLQQLLIDLTGAPFPDLMRELVFQPLNMRNSSYDQSYPHSRPEHTAVGHYIGGEPVYGKWRVLPEMAGAGLWTSASDLALLAIEIQRAHTSQPSSLLTKPVVDQALTSQVADHFGLGTQLEGVGATRRFGHGGDNIGYKCLTTAYMEHGQGAVVLTNGDDGYWVALDVLRALASEYDWPEYGPNRSAIQLEPDACQAYTGEYQLHIALTITISQHNGQLYLAASGQAPFELHASAEARFFARVLNSEIAFTTNVAGEVTGLTLIQEQQELQAKKVR